jgi:hypothetical protein
VRGPPAVNDETWEQIVAAARPHVPDAKAREMLRTCLCEYDKIKSDPAEIKNARTFWNKVAPRLSAITNEFIRARDCGLIPWDDTDQRILHTLSQTQQIVEIKAERARYRSRRHQGRRDPALDFLYGRLFHIWMANFGGKIAVSARPGRPPGGALIRFLTAVLPVLPVFRRMRPNPHSLRTIIVRERQRLRSMPISTIRKKSK